MYVIEEQICCYKWFLHDAQCPVNSILNQKWSFSHMYLTELKQIIMQQLLFRQDTNTFHFT